MKQYVMCVLLQFLGGCLVSQIDAVIASIQTEKAFEHASIAVCAMDAKTGSIVSEFNSVQSLVPASTFKILTTGAALKLLGNEFRYETHMKYTGSFNIQSGALNGDLIIVGSGDPTTQSEHLITRGESITDAWAQAAQLNGIKSISGKIICDASAFERRIPDHWIWADVSNYFGAIPAGLNYKDNKFTIVFSSPAEGKKTTILETFPNYLRNSYSLTANVVAGGRTDQAYVYGDPFSWRREIYGTIPPLKSRFEVDAALPDPALLCAEELCASMHRKKITCDRNLSESRYSKEDTLIVRHHLHTTYSMPLTQIVRQVLLKSNNLYCESLVMTLGKGSMKKGIRVIREFWHRQGLDTNAFHMADGSGLSRANTITAREQARLLSLIFKDAVIYGTVSASMHNQEIKNTAAKNQCRLITKTGYIDRCRAVCGYIKTSADRELAFSVIINNYDCSPAEAKKNLDRIIEQLCGL